MPFTTSQIAMSTSATALTAAAEARTVVELVNLGTVNVSIGASSTVSSTSGFPLIPNAPLRLEGAAASDPIFGIAPSSTPTVAVYARSGIVR